MFNQIERVMGFFAHCDDEMVCAGTLHRLARSGCEVRLVAFAQCATRGDPGGHAVSRQVEGEWAASLRAIGAGESTRYNMRPSADLCSQRQRICQLVYDHVTGFRPDACFVLSRHDQETTHAMLGEECERVMRGRVPFILRCQMPWGCPLDRPNLYVSLSREDLDAKMNVIEVYQSQAFRYNYRDLLYSQARADGLSVKVEYAERFELVRGVI